MTLGQAKKMLFSITDTSRSSTEDNNKAISFFSLGQKEIAVYYPVYKTALYTAGGPRALPADFYKGTRCETLSGQCVAFSVKDGELICSDDDVRLIYEITIPDIPYSAPDSYELLTQEEAALALIYFAAAQFYNNEDSMPTFRSYFSQYEGKLKNLAEQPAQPLAAVMREAQNVYSY